MDVINSNNFVVADPRDDIKQAEIDYFSDIMSDAKENQIFSK